MSSDILNPIDTPREWDAITVSGAVSPGICKLSGFKRSFGWQIKQGKGAKGATLTLNEYPPVEGTVTFQLWQVQDFLDWAEFRPLFKYDATKGAVNAVEIYHPSLADIEVTRVVCKSISAIEPKGLGMYEITVELIEYNPPPKKAAVATPDGAKTSPDNTPGKQADPIAKAQEAEIAKLLKEADP